MSDLVLPEKVRREILKSKWVDLRARHCAQVNRVLDFEDPTCREWTALLREFDPLLKMGRGRNGKVVEGNELGVRPGFFHMVRMNDTAPWSVLPAITAPDGVSFMEPPSSLLEELRGADLQNPNVRRDLLAREQLRERQREADDRARRDQRDEELVERIRSSRDTRVSMSGTFSQNVAGRRGARGK